jgi:hypothetical protein
VKQDINKIEEDIISATEGLRALRKLLATSERARLIACRDHVGTLNINAECLKVELGKTLPLLGQFLEDTDPHRSLQP